MTIAGTWIYLIEKKSEAFDCFRILKSFVERETERKIKCMWSNGEKEYFPANSIVICNKWEFGVNSVADIHRNKRA